MASITDAEIERSQARIAAVLGPDLIVEAAKHPTYDELEARDPQNVNRDERRLMIEALRADRVAWQSKEEKAAAKKAAKEAEKEAA